MLLETELSAQAFCVDAVPAVERRLGRVRDPHDKHAPRTIDVDLSLFNRDVLTVGHRKIPDPEILTRAFVAVPLAELDPEYILPTADGAWRRSRPNWHRRPPCICGRTSCCGDANPFRHGASCELANRRPRGREPKVAASAAMRFSSSGRDRRNEIVGELFQQLVRGAEIDVLARGALAVAAVAAERKEARPLRLQQDLVEGRRVVALVGRFRADENLFSLDVDFERSKLLQQIGDAGAEVLCPLFKHVRAGSAQSGNAHPDLAAGAAHRVGGRHVDGQIDAPGPETATVLGSRSRVAGELPDFVRELTSAGHGRPLILFYRPNGRFISVSIRAASRRTTEPSVCRRRPFRCARAAPRAAGGWPACRARNRA